MRCAAITILNCRACCGLYTTGGGSHDQREGINSAGEARVYRTDVGLLAGPQPTHHIGRGLECGYERLSRLLLPGAGKLEWHGHRCDGQGAVGHSVLHKVQGLRYWTNEVTDGPPSENPIRSANAWVWHNLLQLTAAQPSAVLSVAEVRTKDSPANPLCSGAAGKEG
jgi:hypothetical protein